MSIAARLEMLFDLYAPMVEHDDGETYRDPAYGFISREDFLRLADGCVESGSVVQPVFPQPLQIPERLRLERRRHLDDREDDVCVLRDSEGHVLAKLEAERPDVMN